MTGLREKQTEAQRANVTTLGPWRVHYSESGQAWDIWAPSAKGGETKLFDVRGWGYLTGKGHGALGLSPDDAVKVQAEWARMAAAAPDLLEALKAVVAVADRNTVEFDKARAALAKALPSPLSHRGSHE